MKRILSGILAFLLVLTLMPTVPINATAVAVSESNFEGYTAISTKEELNAIRNDLSGRYYLTCDIVFSAEDFSEGGTFYNDGIGWCPIGSSETPFTGIFDGNGHCISGLKISANITEDPYVGLFGYNKGSIKNIISISGQITVTHASNIVYVGMIAGYSEGIIENCKSVGAISVESTILRATYETPYSYVGGITGCSVGTLSLCENTCDIQATPSVIAYAEAVAYLGGIAGIANSSAISNCVNSGSISLTPTLDANTGITVYAGGISGQSNSNTTGCDNRGSIIVEEFKASSTSEVYINAKFYVAGIIGHSTGTITGSNNSGTVRARGVYAYSGGIAGCNTGTLSQCSNIGNIMAITTCTGSGSYSFGYSGGIAGYSTGTTSESYNTGFVEVSEACASEAGYSGGIVSYQQGGTIINCYNAGYVPDKTYYGDTGGIAGYSTGSISLCYNIGRVPEGYPSGAGAIVGYTSQITPNCFFLDDNKVGVDSGKDSTISCSKEALLLAETYTGFDFNSVWEIGIYDTYPCATLKNVEHKSSMIGNELFAGGTGTAYDPFLIESAEQLNNIRVIPAAYYELIADIAFEDSDYAKGGAFYNNGQGWSPILYFVGSFDGCGHVISNLQIYHAPTSYVQSSEKYASFCDDCFGLFGYNCGGTISRVGVTGNIYVKQFYRPNALDYAYVGGIAGRSNGTITECYFIGSVYGTAGYSSRVGGICGDSWIEGTLKNCFTKVTSSGGGITASSYGYSNCYSVGANIVKGSGSVINCTDAEMRTQSTYAGFDFDSIWTMGGNPDYPYPELKNVNTSYERKAVSISIATLPNKLVYKGGLEELDVSGGKIQVSYDDGSSEIIDLTLIMVTGFDNRIGGTHTLTVTYDGCKTTFEVEVTLFTVTFRDWNGNILLKRRYPYGAKVTVPSDPSRVADNTYTYTFAGWDKAVVDCAGDATYTATYTSTYIDYTVVFKDWNGMVLSTKTYHYGDKVTAPANPTKAADNTYTYSFAGWDKTVVNCAGDATYTATYNSNYIDYTVVFKNWNGDVLSSKTYHYGDKVTAPANPTKAADNTYTYTFAGWDKTVVNCAGDATYTATYTPAYIGYTVVFKNWNGDVLSNKTYHYGDKVTVPSDPSRVADNTYTYTFAGWDKEIVDCAGGAEYTAVFTATHYHTHIESEIVEPTCTEQGYTIYACACGDTYEGDYTESVGHTYANACDTACDVCGNTRTVGPHAYTNNSDTTCDHCGAYAYPGGNTLVKENGTWYHVVDRQKVSDTTLVKFNGYWFYVKDGVVDFGATTLFKFNGYWFYIKNGEINYSDTLVKFNGYWFHVKDGQIDYNPAIVPFNGIRFYVNNGQIEYKSGLTKVNGTWYYLKDGQVDNTDTLVKFNGYWFHVKNGVIDYNPAIVPFNGIRFYVNNGQIEYKSGLTKVNGTWYYLKDGQVDNSNTLVKFNGIWFHVKNGQIDYSTTLVKFNGIWFYVKDGQINYSDTTLVKFNGYWFYVKDGQINYSDTTLVKFNGYWFYVKDGQINYSDTLVKFNGIWFHVKDGQIDYADALVKFNGYTFYVNDGQVSFTTGYVTVNGRTYYAIDGIVKV